MNKNGLLIIGLVIVIIALLVGLGASMWAPAKKDAKLAIVSDDVINEGESIEIKLTGVNDTPLAGETVNVAITGENGKNESQSVIIDENGTGKLALDKSSGNYTINCTYGGNENYSGNTTSKIISVMASKEVVSSDSGSTSQSSGQSKYGSYINGEWVSMSEAEYAERYPALYHIESLEEGRYDSYHPEMYDTDRANGRI